MSAADNLGNLFVALLAGIPLLIFVLFACCACLEASIQAARRSYKPHLPTRVRFADEAETESQCERSQQQRNPLLFGLRSGSSSSRTGGGNGPGRMEGSGLMAHSSYIQRFPNYRYSTVGQPTGRVTPPPVLKSRTDLGSGSLRSPASPLSETQRLLEREYVGILRGSPSRATPPKVGSPASSSILSYSAASRSSAASSQHQPYALPGKPVLRQTNSFLLSSASTIGGGGPSTFSSTFSSAGTPVAPVSDAEEDTQSSQVISDPSSPTLTVSNALTYFDGSRRSSTSTPAFQNRSRESRSPLFQRCSGPLIDSQQTRRYSTPSSPTMLSYHYEQRPQNHSNYSSMSYLPEVRTYLNFLEEDMSNRQRSHSFSGRSARRSPRPGQPLFDSYHLPSPTRSQSPFTLELSALDSGDQEEASKLSTPSSFETTFLTPPGSTDQGSFKSPESGTPDWLLSSEVAPLRFVSVTALADPENPGVNYKQPLTQSKSCSIRTATI